jgi:hypothetical protein
MPIKASKDVWRTTIRLSSFAAVQDRCLNDEELLRLIQHREPGEAAEGGMEEEGASPIEACKLPNRDAKRAWVRLIKQVHDVDPLVCPRCAGAMRIIAFIEQPAVI